MPVVFEEPSSPLSSAQPPSVLVIDDDVSMRTVVRRMLEREGYPVVESMAAAHMVAHWHCTILPKPFGAAELIDALQELERGG
jgi:hypothetical protein